MELLSIAIVLLAVSLIFSAIIVSNAIKGLSFPSSSPVQPYHLARTRPDYFTTDATRTPEIVSTTKPMTVEEERIEIQKKAAFNGPVMRTVGGNVSESTRDCDVAKIAQSIKERTG